MLYNKVMDSHRHRHTASRQTQDEFNLTSCNMVEKNFKMEVWKTDHLYLYKDYSH